MIRISFVLLLVCLRFRTKDRLSVGPFTLIYWFALPAKVSVQIGPTGPAMVIEARDTIATIIATANTIRVILAHPLTGQGLHEFGDPVQEPPVR
jgi:hypothetical protein